MIPGGLMKHTWPGKLQFAVMSVLRNDRIGTGQIRTVVQAVDRRLLLGEQLLEPSVDQFEGLFVKEAAGDARFVRQGHEPIPGRAQAADRVGGAEDELNLIGPGKRTIRDHQGAVATDKDGVVRHDDSLRLPFGST